MQRAIYLIGIFIAGGTLFTAEPQQSTSPFNGTWELNTAKSKVSPGPMAKNQTRTYEITGNSEKFTVKGINGDGTSLLGGYTAAYDEKDYPTTGSQLFNSISLKRIDPFNVDAVNKKDGKVVIRSHNEVSKDGRTMTIATKGINARGETVNNVTVYDKQ